MAAAITSINPSYAKASGQFTITGTGFEDDPSLTRVWFRETGTAGAYSEVDATRVGYVSATELTVDIDADNTDAWNNGLNDVGVSVIGEEAPEDSLYGALHFFVAGTFAPDDVIKGALEELYIAGIFMGHTHGEASVDHGIDLSEIEVEQSLYPIRQTKSGESFTLGVPMAEVTLEHLKEVWGVSSAIEDLGDGRKRLRFGGDTTVTEKEVLAIVPAGGSKKFAIQFYRCAITAPGTLTWGRDEQVDLPLEITVLADTARPVGDQIGNIEEYTPA